VWLAHSLDHSAKYRAILKFHLFLRAFKEIFSFLQSFLNCPLLGWVHVLIDVSVMSLVNGDLQELLYFFG
jgi:hypothetical protein